MTRQEIIETISMCAWDDGCKHKCEFAGEENCGGLLLDKMADSIIHELQRIDRALQECYGKIDYHRKFAKVYEVSGSKDNMINHLALADGYKDFVALLKGDDSHANPSE